MMHCNQIMRQVEPVKFPSITYDLREDTEPEYADFIRGLYKNSREALMIGQPRAAAILRALADELTEAL